jgi:hypothetical protein
VTQKEILPENNFLQPSPASSNSDSDGEAAPYVDSFKGIHKYLLKAHNRLYNRQAKMMKKIVNQDKRMDYQIKVTEEARDFSIKAFHAQTITEFDITNYVPFSDNDKIEEFFAMDEG